ncbi:pyrroline-5-carboxylate reductase [Nitriliruptoraceae bacterium ZYF776]|nr:pyrroline-5-carboxylate reductase [Profundirhabdus halotolerans]
MDGTLAIVGTGRMGEALLRGLLAGGTLPPERIVCTDAVPARRAQLEADHGVRATADNRAALAEADVVLLALKPQILPRVLEEVGDAFRSTQTVISVAAGITTGLIERFLPADTPVIRVMSNTPAMVDEGMSVLAAGSHATEPDLALAESLLSAVGTTLRLPESQLDAVTAVSGSGPAYLFLLAEAMIEGGVHAGLTRHDATTLVVQTLRGSATLLRDTGEHPSLLREAVTSPAGTTAAGLGELERSGFRGGVIAAIAAATRRGEELARG